MTSERLSKIVIQEDISIKDTIENLSLSGLQISLVVDKSYKLVASITDGDIRRGIVSGLSLDDPVSKVANYTPVWVEENTPREIMLSILKKNNISQLPILDKNKVLIDIKILSDFETIDILKNIFIIMAGGFGKRLGSLTDDSPKPMLGVAGKPILEHIINQAKKSGFRKFYITTHYLPQKIYDYFGTGKDFDVEIEYVEEKEPLGTAGSLGLIDYKGALPIILSNGDLMAKVDFGDFLQYHFSKNSDITVAVRYHEMINQFGVVKLNGEKIEGIEEKPIYKSLVNAGIYIIQPEIIKMVSKNQYLNMPELIEKCIDKDKKIYAYPIYEPWIDIGVKEDYLKAARNES